jgi:glycosyltransferase involved in cell wall biosynthesis
MRGTVRNLLLLISSLDYSGPARRLCSLARGLSREGFRVRVGVLETTAPWAEALRQDGVDLDIYGWKRPIDMEPFFALRRSLKANRLDVVHAFGSTALRALKLCGLRGVRVLGSDLLHGGGPPAGWAVDRWLLRGKGRVLAFGAAEALRYQRAGVAAERIVQATPGVEESDGGGEAVGWPMGRVLLSVGPIEVHKGFRDAVWAFDILHYLFDDLRLAFLGDGSDRRRVADFARAVGAASWLTFLGKRPSVEPYLSRAAIVWITSRTAGGVCTALEAMAAGRPVVATRVPELEEIVVDGETGFLVPPGDKAALARQTRLLLGEESLAQRFAAAGKQRVRERFSAARMVAECAAIYRQIAG